MTRFILPYLFCLLVINLGCSENRQDDVVEEVPQAINHYEDGLHCAEVNYYNPQTHTSSTYTLEVEVENNEVVKIIFGNGGWLDSDHMNPQELDEDGECKISSYEGPEYKVKIVSESCSSYDILDYSSIRSYTMAQCAEVLNMTEEEITDYELRFSSRRTDVFSAEMCESFRKYIIESRRSKAKMAAIENEFNEGHIESVQIRSTGDVVTCHNIIVKKFGRYYWLEVNSTEKCTMGLLKFDETASGWQEVVVTEDPTKLEANIYRMRVIEDAADKDPLQYSIDNYCEKY